MTDLIAYYLCIASTVWAVAWGLTRDVVWRHKAEIAKLKAGPLREPNGRFKAKGLTSAEFAAINRANPGIPYDKVRQ